MKSYVSCVVHSADLMSKRLPLRPNRHDVAAVSAARQPNRRGRAPYRHGVRGRRVIVAGVAAEMCGMATPSFAVPVPPPAPAPTDSGASPMAPDPHPPLGGIGPDGQDVGGAKLRARGTIVPKHAPRLPADITAAAFVLVDLDSGNILAARDPHGRYQPA